MRIQSFEILNATNPIGTGEAPYFSWKLESEENNTLQESYQLTVLDPEGKECMNSGVIKNRKNAYVRYQGAALKSRTTYTALLKVSDNHGETAQQTGTFETALLSPKDWSAKWAAPVKKRKKNKPGFRMQWPSTLFRQTITLSKKICKARLYVTCHGTYEMYVNGIRPDDRFFAPEHTVYEKYLCYQTYDVTSLLKQGKNVIGMHVGDGWFFCPNAKPNMKLDYQHAVLFQLEVTYEDHEMEVFGSGETTKSFSGPVISADLYAGEAYDANQEQEKWNCQEYEDSQWETCRLMNYGYENLMPQNTDSVIVINRLPVKEIKKSSKGECILDFGQNLAGIVEVHIKLKKGQVLRLEHCEVLDREGNYFNNIMSVGGVGKGCDQTDEYISSGKEAIYHPHFTYHGFRYVRVTIDGKAPQHLEEKDFQVLVLSSRKKNTGEFHCSNDMINQLYNNVRWSQYSNMLSIPTDCPQREKAGWTGDMLVYAKTAMQNEDCTLLFLRWLENMEKEQDKYGIIPMVVPENGSYPMVGKLTSMTSGCKGKGTSSGWGDAAVIVPYSMYEITDNTEVLIRQYECMKKWCDYVIHQAATRKPKKSERPEEVEKYLWDTGYHYGEWLIPSQSQNGVDMKHLKEIMAQSSCYTAPIFGWNSVNIFAKIAGKLAALTQEDNIYAQDAAKYQTIADRMKQAFQQGIIREDGSMPSDLMGAYVLPIYFGLVPEKYQETFAGNLVKSIEENHYKMDTGFLGSPYLLDALCKINRQDLAFRLLLQEEKPSWLSEVKMGATTIWENCFGYDEQGNPGTLSFNHYAFGSVCDWIYRNIGGIIPDNAGYMDVTIQPILDESIKSASRIFESVNGAITVDWKVDNQNYFLDVSIPCNVTANVILPSGKECSIGSGRYHFEEKYLTKK